MESGFYNFARQVRKISQIYIFYTMKLKNFFLAALAAAFTFASCEPADPETPQTPDQEETPGDNENPGDTEEPSTPSDAFQAGQYWITGTKDGVTKVMMPVAEDKTFGYAPSEAFANNASYADNVFTFAAVEGGFTICDASGKYYSQEAGTTHKTFSVGTDGTLAGCVWTVAKNDDNTYTITNAASGKIVRYAEGTYTSFGVYAESEFNGSVAVNLVPAANAQARPVLDVPATASVENNVTTYSVEVESNLAWTATAGAGVTLDKTSGNGNATVVLTFAANTGDAAVTYTVTFTAGELTKTFTLTQKAAASETPATGVKTLTNDEIIDAMTGTDNSYSTYDITSASGTWTVNASRNKENTFLQCRGKKGGYIKTPAFDKDIKSVTIHFSSAKSVYKDNTYCAFPSTWTAPTADAAYPETGNVGKAVTDGSYSLTIPVAAGNKQVYISIISTYAYYLDHIDVAF